MATSKIYRNFLAFGLGDYVKNAQIVSDANDITVTGFYATDTLTLNLPSNLSQTADYQGALLHISRGAQFMVQYYYCYTSHQVYRRIKSVDAWSSASAWTCIDGDKITGSITSLLSAGTLVHNTCYKVGNVVYVSGRIQGIPDNTVLANATAFQISDGFRPPYGIRANGNIVVQGQTNAIPVTLAIGTDGKVSMGFSFSSYVNVVAFEACYPVE